MGARNNMFGLIFLMGVLAFTVFAAKRLLFRPSPSTNGVGALLGRAKPPAKPSEPKPSAAVPAKPSSAPSSSALPATMPAPTSSGQAQAPTPEASGAVASAKQEPSTAGSSAATATEDHHPENHASENRGPANHVLEHHRPQLRLESGIRLWIRVTAISREPDGSFTFRGTLLQPVELAHANQLDQGTELSGSGAVINGHVTVFVRTFTIGGANYALQDASGSNKRPGSGLAVELDPGKLLEVWLASPSVYRKTP